MAAQEESGVLIAIDFGTTFTGLAWGVVKGGKLIDQALFLDWPSFTAQKTPSAISFSGTRQGHRQWGYDIGAESNVIRWMKLDFETRSRVEELKKLRSVVRGMSVVTEFEADPTAFILKNLPPRFLGMDAEDIATEYLKRIAKYWSEKYKEHADRVLANVPIDLIVTHPGTWSDEAMNKTVRSVLAAFSTNLFPQRRHVYLCTEPEACALYTALNASKKDRARLVTGDTFIVCDAGGGTVDLCSFRFESQEPFQIVPLSSPASVYHGATELDRAFLLYVQKIFQNVVANPDEAGVGGLRAFNPHEELLLDQFTNGKRSFSGEADDECILSYPRKWKVHQDAWAQSKVKNDNLRLTSEELAEIFDPTVHQILEAIARQVALLEVRGLNVTHVFMSGGFSASPYLFRKVTEWATTMGTLQVERGDDCWGAVARGALMKCAGFGATPPVAIKTCPRSYGLSLAQTFAAHKGFKTQTLQKMKVTGKVMAMNQITWLVSTGDLIPTNKPIIRKQALNFCIKKSDLQSLLTSHVRVVACAKEGRERPICLTDCDGPLSECKTLEFNLKDIPTAEQKMEGSLLHQYAKVSMTLELRVHSDVVFTLICGSNTMASCRLEL